jgi:hypothetical protein
MLPQILDRIVIVLAQPNLADGFRISLAMFAIIEMQASSEMPGMRRLSCARNFGNLSRESSVKGARPAATAMGG